MKPEQVWCAALGELQLQMTRASYDTWLRDTNLLAHEDGVYIVGVRSGYAKDWLDERMLSTVERTLSGISGVGAGVRFVVWDDEIVSDESSFSLQAHPSQAESVGNDPVVDASVFRFSFERFVVGNSNRLAHAAALTAADKPGEAYNPLFIHGDVGLGKTHLLRAIADTCELQGRRVLWLSSEEFTNELVQAIRSRSTESFRNNCRTVDVFLLDDVHFVAGKESTQEELVHTFNALHNQNKQLVFSSNLPPRDIPALDARLRSRFEWGLVTEMQRPGRDLRFKVLSFLSSSLSVSVPPKVLRLIAERVPGNMRSLEGALTQLVARSEILGHPLDMRSAELSLESFGKKSGRITPENVVTAVALHYDLSSEDLRGRSREKAIALPRQLAMYLIRKETGASLPRTGKALGGRDHSTIKYGCDKASRLMKENSSFRRQANAIRESLYLSP